MVSNRHQVLKIRRMLRRQSEEWESEVFSCKLEQG